MKMEHTIHLKSGKQHNKIKKAITAIALIMCGIGHFFAISIKIGKAFSHAYPHNDQIIFFFRSFSRFGSFV